MEQYGGGGGSWTIIPNVQAHSNSPAQDQFFTTSQQQPRQQQQHFNQQFHPHQQRRLIHGQQQHHPSLASQSHLLPNLADAIDNGTRDQHSDALVNELNSNFDKCQHLLNSLFGSNTSKSMTVEGQRQKVEETEQLLNQWRELIVKCRSSDEELIKPELLIPAFLKLSRQHLLEMVVDSAFQEYNFHKLVFLQ